ncbi:MAG: OsmC family protein [Desulfovibrio sp.]|nr:OsmC family protein [Desulfovibrio sp.]
MAKITGEYLGDLRIDCVREDNGAKLTLESLFENFGGESHFSPTDLVALGLASCALNTIGIYCHRREIDIDGAIFSVGKTMATQPNRIAKIRTVFTFPAKGYNEKERAGIERCLRSCPVHNSLSERMEQEFVFNWLDDAGK